MNIIVLHIQPFFIRFKSLFPQLFGFSYHIQNMFINYEFAINGPFKAKIKPTPIFILYIE